MKKSQHRIDLHDCIRERDRSRDNWSIHVDEVAQWCPRGNTFEEWVAQLCQLYNDVCELVPSSEVVVATLTLESTQALETFKNPANLSVDALMPPSLYILNADLEFPAEAEQYYRIVGANEISASIKKGVVIVRSARGFLEFQNDEEFDNTIYISSRFHDAPTSPIW